MLVSDGDNAKRFKKYDTNFDGGARRWGHTAVWGFDVLSLFGEYRPLEAVVAEPFVGHLVSIFRDKIVRCTLAMTPQSILER